MSEYRRGGRNNFSTFCSAQYPGFANAKDRHIATILPPQRSRFAAWALVLIVLSLAAGIGMREPMPPDEPRFALMAQHMVESGNWLFPHRGHELYAEKPPTFMWMQAAAYQVGRDWRIAFLLPSLLAGLATLAFTCDIARRLWNWRIGIVAAGALFACVQFGLQAKRAQIDMVLVALTTMALWALLRVLLLRGHKSLAVVGGFASGLGTVTKGVGFLPLLLLPSAMALRRFLAKGNALPSLAPMTILALAGFVLGALVWLAPMLFAVLGSEDPALHGYARDLLLRQTGERYADPWHHVQPFWYYAKTIFTLWLPGALLLPWLVPAWWNRIKRRDARFVLPLVWGVLVLLFFNVSPGKREVYIFPALPAFCMAAAPLLPALLRRADVRGVLLGWLVLLAIAAAAGAAFAWLDPHSRASAMALKRGLDISVLQALAISFAVLAAGVALVAFVLRRKPARAVVLGTSILWFVVGFGVAPALSEDSSGSVLMRRVGERIGMEAELGLVAWTEQVLLQADRPVREFGFKRAVEDQWRDGAAWVREHPSRRWLLVNAQALDGCAEREQTVAVGRSNRRDWVLVPAAALHGNCGDSP
ncbi:MAG: glycosyltransferase family 39 protein [Lysobacteraceae bacterium]